MKNVATVHDHVPGVSVKGFVGAVAVSIGLWAVILSAFLPLL